MPPLFDLGPLSTAVPPPVVIAGGAGAVIATAAALSGRAARHPDLPTTRWTHPLPRAVRRVVDARAPRALARAVGLLAAVTGIVALWTRQAPVDGLVVLPALTLVALVAGPIHRRGATGATALDGADQRAAVLWSAALCAVALSTRDPAILALTAALVVAAQVAPVPRAASPGSALGALVDLVGHLAPIGRDRAGRPAWRNPLVAVTHADLPPGGLALATVVIAASGTHALAPATGPLATLGPAAPAAGFVLSLVVVAVVLRLGVIRPFFRSAVVPVVAAYGLVAAGRWAPPADLLVFVGLHMVAVAALHRQALARHDLRTARAVQFPLRVVLVVSVLSGVALLLGR